MLTELAITSLALSLATNPTPHTVSIYNGLAAPDQAKVIFMVNNQDLIPQKLQQLIEKSVGQSTERPNPTNETSTSNLTND